LQATSIHFYFIPLCTTFAAVKKLLAVANCIFLFTMIFLSIFIVTILAYLLGSVPAGLLVGKLLYGIDIREHGNGSASWDNIWAVISGRAAAYTAALDISKGFLASCLTLIAHVQLNLFSETQYPILMLSVGLAAIAGHFISPFNEFRKNPEMSCVLGVMCAINPWAALIVGVLAFCSYYISEKIWQCNVILLLGFPILVGSLYPSLHISLYPVLGFMSVLIIALLYAYRVHTQRVMSRILNVRSYKARRLRRKK
jgi:acyl phosphate:glycerol-3-phosphate acyltransferase